MAISRDEVEKVSLLGRLLLSEPELEKMTAQLGQILDYMDLLGEVDTEGVEPMAHALAVADVFREDTPGKSLDRLFNLFGNLTAVGSKGEDDLRGALSDLVLPPLRVGYRRLGTLVYRIEGLEMADLFLSIGSVSLQNLQINGILVFGSGGKSSQMNHLLRFVFVYREHVS